MEKTNLEILDYEDKTSQAGDRYFRFNTSQGWMACFPDFKDKKNFTLINAILAQKGKGMICVGISTNDHGSTIQKFFGSEDLSLKEAKEKSLPPQTNENEKLEVPVVRPGKPEPQIIDAKTWKSQERFRTPEEMIMCEMVGYAKDVFNELRKDQVNINIPSEDLMNDAIAAIKQAQEAFS